MVILIPNQLEGIIQNFQDEEQQTQSAGYDLTVKSIQKFVTEGILAVSNENRLISKTNEIECLDNMFNLSPGGYLLRYNESVHVPKSAAAITLPRSSLMRMGATIHSALWDPGYEGVGMGLLTVTNPIKIEKNARIAQIIFFNLSETVDEGYSGQYQQEGLSP